MSLVYSINETARALSLGRTTIYALIKQAPNERPLRDSILPVPRSVARDPPNSFVSITAFSLKCFDTPGRNPPQPLALRLQTGSWLVGRQLCDKLILEIGQWIALILASHYRLLTTLLQVRSFKKCGITR